MLEDALPEYPVPVLEPGDEVLIPFIPSWGEPAAANVVLRGRVKGVEYQRTRDGENIWVIEKDFPV